MSMFWIIYTLAITGELQPFSDALFMWTAPPPAWNQTNPGNHPADIQTAVFRVLKGTTNYQVRWYYRLLKGQSIRITTFSIRLPGSSHTDDIGDVINGGSTINDKDNYGIRFKLESTSEYSTLTITNVTESATYQCKMHVGGNTWAYNVRIEVTGTRPVISTTTSPPIGKTTPLLPIGKTTPLLPIGKTTPSPPLGKTTSRSSDTALSPSPSNSGDTIGSIVSVVLVTIAVISIIVAAVILWYCKKKRNRSVNQEEFKVSSALSGPECLRLN